ncbi:MAG: VWD domain-containing protein [Pseudomonadota bacterium]
MGLPSKCGGGGGGDPHLYTIDGTYYGFQAAGEFVLLRSPGRDLEIQMRTRPVRDTVSSIKGIAVRAVQTRFTIQYGRDSLVHINGEPVSLDEDIEFSIDPADLPAIYRPKRNRYVIVVDEDTIIRVDANGFWMNFDTQISRQTYDDLTGLLGDGDGQSANDLRSRSGMEIYLDTLDEAARHNALYRMFGDSWRIAQEESLFDYADGESTETFTDKAYPKISEDADTEPKLSRAEAEEVCRAAGLTSGIFFETCVYDVMMTGERGYAEAAAAIGADATDVITRRATRIGGPIAVSADTSPNSTSDTAPVFEDMMQEGISFKVNSVVAPGEEVTATWTDALPNRAFMLRLVDTEDDNPRSVSPYGVSLSSAELGDSDKTFTFTAPGQPGFYMLRYVDWQDKTIAARVYIRVVSDVSPKEDDLNLDPSILISTPGIELNFAKTIAVGEPIAVTWVDADTSRNYIIEVVEAGDTTYNSMSYGGRWTQARRNGYDTREWTTKPINEPGQYSMRYVDRGTRTILHLETFEVVVADETQP